MASLSSSLNVGNTSTSALIRSSSSLQNQIATYNDSLAAYQYELSAKTSDDLSVYQNYLNTRISTLSSTGSVTDASKALTLTKTLTTAVHSNVSADIQRENIQVMSGNGTLQDKYDAISSQYTRALSVGDLALGQSLESQAYSVSQQIQYQQQQAAQAATTLAKATSDNAVYAEAGISASLDESLKQLTHGIAQAGPETADKLSGQWVAQNKAALQSMGVVIPDGAQPNYWNLVEGIQAAKYNAIVLEAQAKAPTDPKGAQALAFQAANLMNGTTKVGDTLAGSLSVQEIQQAAQDPNMFKFNDATGQYQKTAQVGYQYLNDAQTGQNYVAPEYSGQTTQQRNQIYFLNPQQTSQLTTLGLNFTMNKSGTTGDGVTVSTTDNTPQWLKNSIGDRTQVYVGKSGDLQFEGPSSTGQGQSYYSLMNVGGLYGIFEHNADGSTKLAGGNYGFDSGAAQLLVNAGQIKQQQIQLQVKAQQAAQAAALKISQPAALPTISVAAPGPTAPANAPTAAGTIQPTITTQALQPTTNPQSNNVNPQASNSGEAINQGGKTTGITFSNPSLPGIRL